MSDMEWISVDDKLPEPNKPVLLFVDKRGIIEGSIDNKDITDYDLIYCAIHGGGCCGEYSDKITHWMPLPEPPK